MDETLVLRWKSSDDTVVDTTEPIDKVRHNYPREYNIWRQTQSVCNTPDNVIIVEQYEVGLLMEFARYARSHPTNVSIDLNINDTNIDDVDTPIDTNDTNNMIADENDMNADEDKDGDDDMNDDAEDDVLINNKYATDVDEDDDMNALDEDDDMNALDSRHCNQPLQRPRPRKKREKEKKGNERKEHDFLKIYSDDEKSATISQRRTVSDDNVYEVDEVLAVAKWTGYDKIMYLTKWTGYKLCESTWEPESSFASAQEVLSVFKNKTRDNGVIICDKHKGFTVTPCWAHNATKNANKGMINLDREKLGKRLAFENCFLYQ